MKKPPAPDNNNNSTSLIYLNDNTEEPLKCLLCLSWNDGTSLKMSKCGQAFHKQCLIKKMGL